MAGAYQPVADVKKGLLGYIPWVSSFHRPQTLLCPRLPHRTAPPIAAVRFQGTPKGLGFSAWFTSRIEQIDHDLQIIQILTCRYEVLCRICIVQSPPRKHWCVWLPSRKLYVLL